MCVSRCLWFVVITALIRSHAVAQVLASGVVSITNSVSMPSGGLSVVGGVSSNLDAVITNSVITGTNGAMSITSTSTSASAADIYASSTVATGNVIFGGVTGGVTVGSLLTLSEGGNTRFSVR